MSEVQKMESFLKASGVTVQWWHRPLLEAMAKKQRVVLTGRRIGRSQFSEAMKKYDGYIDTPADKEGEGLWARETEE